MTLVQFEESICHYLTRLHWEIYLSTCVLGKGLDDVSFHNSRRANVVCFDHEDTIKRNLPIVSAITALDLPNGSSILLVVRECIYNETSNHSLLSEFQLR